MSEFEFTMNLVAIFFFLVTLEMAVGEEEKVQDEPNPDVITLIKKMLQRLDKMDGRLDKIEKKFETSERRSDRRFDAVNERLDTNIKRFDAVDKRFDAVDQRFDAMDKRFDAVDIQLKVVARKTKADEEMIDANTKSVQELSNVISTTLHNISKDVKDVKEALTEGTCFRFTITCVKSLIAQYLRNYALR